MTSDPSVAKTFSQLRGDSGSGYRSKKPDACQSVACDLEYPHLSGQQDGPVFKADAMEDKWDIYIYDDQLYFCRSWSGDLAYRATLRLEVDKLLVTQIDYAKPRAEKPVDAVRDVDYLIKSHVYGAVIPHPFPKNMPRDSEKLAFYSFARFGRRCLYGSYDDTLKIPVDKSGPSGGKY